MKQRDKFTAGDQYGASVKSRQVMDALVAMKGRWEAVCYGPDGQEKWRDEIENLVVDEGLDHILDSTLAGGTQVTSWFVGLTDGTPTTAAGDTLSSHAGWTEVQAYDEAARPGWTAGAVSGQSVDNSGTTADFSINSASTTIGGAFLASDSTKGGTTGTLYAVGAFTGGDKTLGSGDTLNVTATFTSAAA